MGGFAGIVGGAVGALGGDLVDARAHPVPFAIDRLWTFGDREIDVACDPSEEAALIVCGYVRGEDERLSASVLLERWRGKGAALLRELRGEFCLAVRSGGRLVVARDATGTRPLYTAELPGGRLGFATSIRPLLHMGARPDVDRDAIVRSLVLGYVPAPQTTLRCVRQVGPGEAWTLAPTHAVERHFRPRERLARHRSFEESARRLDAVITRSVVEALDAPGRVGAFLSGGLDSSLVLARVHEAGRPVEAFTLHFGDHLPSELRYALAVTSYLGVRHHIFELDDRDFVDGIAPALEHLEDLLSEPISVPNFLLARQAARSVDLLFTGEGGDPPFGGPKNVGMVLASAYAGLPGAPSLADAYFTAHHHLADDLAIALTDEWAASFDRARLASDLDLGSLDRSGASHTTFVGRLMLANVVWKGGSNILVKAAKMVGAHDLALRSPLFDRGLVELAFSIPPGHKLRGTKEKLVLKAAARRSLPRCIIERSKRGMAVPLRAWFAGALGVLARDVLTERAVRERGLFRWAYVERLLRLEDSPTDLSRSRAAEKLWMVLVAELQQRTLERLARRHHV